MAEPNIPSDIRKMSFEQALDELKEIVERLEQGQGELDQAIKVGLRIVELDSEDAFAHTSLSMFYQRKGLIEEAEKEGAKARMAAWKKDLKDNPDAPPPGPAGSMPVVQ